MAVDVTQVGGGMWYALWRGVFASDARDAGVGGFAGLGEGVVAGVEVFSLLCEEAVSMAI